MLGGTGHGVDLSFQVVKQHLPSIAVSRADRARGAPFASLVDMTVVTEV